MLRIPPAREPATVWMTDTESTAHRSRVTAPCADTNRSRSMAHRGTARSANGNATSVTRKARTRRQVATGPARLDRARSSPWTADTACSYLTGSRAAWAADCALSASSSGRSAARTFDLHTAGRASRGSLSATGSD